MATNGGNGRIGGAWVLGQRQEKRRFYVDDPELVRWAIDAARDKGKKQLTISQWRQYWNWFHAWLRAHDHRGDVVDWKTTLAYLEDVERSDKSHNQKKQNVQAVLRLFEYRKDAVLRAVSRGKVPIVPLAVAKEDLDAVQGYKLPSEGQVHKEGGWLPYDLETLWKIVDVAEREGYAVPVYLLIYSWGARVSILSSPWDPETIVAALPEGQRRALAPAVREKAPRFFDLDAGTWHGPVKGHKLKTLKLEPPLVELLRKERAARPGTYGPCPTFDWSFSDGVQAPAGIPCADCGETPPIRWVHLAAPPRVLCDHCTMIVQQGANQNRAKAAEAMWAKLEKALEAAYGVKENLHAHRIRESVVTYGLDKTNLSEDDLRQLLAQKNVETTRIYDKRDARAMKAKTKGIDLVQLSREADGQGVARQTDPVAVLEEFIAGLEPKVRELAEPILRGAQETIRRALALNGGSG